MNLDCEDFPKIIFSFAETEGLHFICLAPEISAAQYEVETNAIVYKT
jgi:hypothetical protein